MLNTGSGFRPHYRAHATRSESSEMSIARFWAVERVSREVYAPHPSHYPLQQGFYRLKMQWGPCHCWGGVLLLWFLELGWTLQVLVSCGPGWSLWGWPVSCCSAVSRPEHFSVLIEQSLYSIECKQRIHRIILLISLWNIKFHKLLFVECWGGNPGHLSC
jgi:hypothetical protein